MKKGKERDGKKDASLGRRGVSVARRGFVYSGLTSRDVLLLEPGAQSE